MNHKVAFKLGEIATVMGVATLCAALAGCQTVKEVVTDIPVEWWDRAAAAAVGWFVM